MLLTDLTKQISCNKIYNTTKKNINFNHIFTNSKSIKKFSIFAVNNNKFKQIFINEAIKKGSVAILSYKYFKKYKIPQYIVKDVNLSISRLLYKLLPNKPINSVAITGTNGKTSVVWFISQICLHNNLPIKTYGTLGYYINGKKKDDSILTTPEYEVLHQNAFLKKKNFFNFVFEVSSHALDQDRLKKFPVNIAALTNISHDHLDYHKNLKNYKKTKLKLFIKHLNKGGSAIINDKIKGIEKFKKKLGTKYKIITYGKINSHINLISKKNCTEIKIFKKKYLLKVDYYTQFELENIACAIACCLCLEIKVEFILKSLIKIENPPGRLEKVSSINNDIKVYVDYAHTPDALKNVLISQTVKNKKPNLVFGCGGNRDKYKRRKMGLIANNYADKVYITDDNPRNENPSKIRKSIITNCKKGIEIVSRKQAIKIAINDLKKNDILIIAGKGHEKIQITKNKIKLFDDVKIAKKELKKRFLNERN